MNKRIRTIKLFGIMISALLVPKAYSLDRLFTTPEERKELDIARFQVVRSDVLPQEQVPQTITVNGVVLPRNGKNNVWINDTNVQSRHSANGFVTRPRKARYNRVPVHVIGESADVLLRPGETYFVENRSKKDAFEWMPEPAADDQGGQKSDVAEPIDITEPDSSDASSTDS